MKFCKNCNNLMINTCTHCNKKKSIVTNNFLFIFSDDSVLKTLFKKDKPGAYIL